MDEVQSYLASVFLAKKYKTALELGCSVGNLTRFLSELTNVSGSDISNEYIKKAKKQHKGIRFFVSDARTMRLKRKCDVIVTHGLLIHIPDKDIEKTIKNIMRYAKNGLFVESSAVETTNKVLSQKYNPKKYWSHRARYPDEKDDLPMKYYYSHDYVKLFTKLKLKFQIIKEFDCATKTRMYLVWK